MVGSRTDSCEIVAEVARLRRDSRSLWLWEAEKRIYDKLKGDRR